MIRARNKLFEGWGRTLSELSLLDLEQERGGKDLPLSEQVGSDLATAADPPAKDCCG